MAVNGNPLLPRTPRVRSYVRTGTYTPKSGPLAGQLFTGTPGTTQAYNRYQQARARALGFSTYTEQRRLAATLNTPTPFGSVFQQVRKGTHFGEAGQLTAQHRVEVMQALQPFWNGRTIDLNDPITGQPDRRIGGKLDLYLRALGRRQGNESWAPGATPK